MSFDLSSFEPSPSVSCTCSLRKPAEGGGTHTPTPNALLFPVFIRLRSKGPKAHSLLLSMFLRLFAVQIWYGPNDIPCPILLRGSRTCMMCVCIYISIYVIPLYSNIKYHNAFADENICHVETRMFYARPPFCQEGTQGNALGEGVARMARPIISIQFNPYHLKASIWGVPFGISAKAQLLCSLLCKPKI